MKRMKVGRPGKGTARAVVVLDAALGFWVGVMALKSRQSKNEIVAQACVEYLKRQGVEDPGTIPSSIAFDVKPQP